MKKVAMRHSVLTGILFTLKMIQIIWCMFSKRKHTHTHVGTNIRSNVCLAYVEGV